MLNYVYGSKNRIFVNTVIGCNASCSYCYLPTIQQDSLGSKITAQEVIKHMDAVKEFVPGKDNTIVSLGCYSECMFTENIEDTLQLIRFFCEKRNYIQLATKQKISEDVCEKLSEYQFYKNQINVYISMPTYSKIKAFEQGTATVEERIHNIEMCKEYGINVVLYIKPYLETISFGDLEHYIDLVKRYNIPVVVGEYLSINKTKCIADVGEELLYEHGKTNEMNLFISKLSEHATVYEHSIDFINDIREEKEDEPRGGCENN